MSVELTESAARRIREQLKSRGHGIGLRVGISRTGCSGYGYRLDYADELGEQDLVFESHGAKVVVSHDDLPLLEGLTIDFVREGVNRVFRFRNPKARATCGCGESFTV